MWQLGAMIMRPEVHEAAELIIGNLDEDGYLTATEEELLAAAIPPSNNRNGAENAGPGTTPGTGDSQKPPARITHGEGTPLLTTSLAEPPLARSMLNTAEITNVATEAEGAGVTQTVGLLHAEQNLTPEMTIVPPRTGPRALFSRTDLHEALELVRQMDPVGVASRDLRECLLAQLKYHHGVHERQKAKTGQNGATDELLRDATLIVGDHLRLVQNKQTKELAKAIGRPIEAVQTALDFIKTLDPRPGQRYNKVEPRLIEPDVAFIKQGDEYMVVLNDDDVPQLRLNPTYRRLLNRDEAEKDVRSYIKEKYKSAIQLIKNIEQRKQTILKVCYAIIGRQREFLDKGIDCLMPMMIKEVAEEIGVHPSTVSRAVASKYAHTPQGVFELRFFFSESVQGPEGGNTSLLILKRRVKKLIEEEDPARPYTDEQITRILQSQGIQVTRRTVAKYREDMRIPSTHQRRVKN
jgi:RNA polymerase sigma-54 factor